MNFRINIIFLLLFSSGLAIAQSTERQCLTDQVYQEHIERDPSIIEKRITLEKASQAWIKANEDRAETRELITIPVVVHIVWNQSSENISDEMVKSQIEVLNEDFRFNNLNKNTIPDEFSELGADIDVEFCLASRDPNGNFTTGILRTQTNTRFIATDKSDDGRYKVKHSSLGGSSAWDTRSYLNIWVAKSSQGILGYACFPGVCSDLEDGVVINVDNFGRNENPGSNSLGRTATHEVGHYLNLNHLWGSESASCDQDDNVEDTPSQFTNTRGCPNHPKASCSSNDMFMNYMDYSDDNCVSMFTKGQKARMLSVFDGARRTLLASQACQSPVSTKNTILDGHVNLFPNPAYDHLQINIDIPHKQFVNFELIDLLGQTIQRQKLRANSSTQLSLVDYPEGIYFVKLEAEGAVLTRRVLIVR